MGNQLNCNKMDRVKLEEFKCSNYYTGAEGPTNYGGCGKIPSPGDKIYSCSLCPEDYKYRCETCFNTKNGGHHHGYTRLNSLAFEPTLTKLVSEHFTTPSCDESQKCDYFCSNSKNGCQEEFLALHSWSSRLNFDYTLRLLQSYLLGYFKSNH